MRKLARPLSLVIAIILSVLVAGCGRDAPEQPAGTAPTPIVVLEYTSPASIDFRYPQEWSMTILTQGMMVIAPSEVLSLERPGPSVTIFRVPPGLSESNLALSLEEFLRKGPLGENFVLSSEIREQQIGQYTGLSVDMDRAASDELMALKGYMVAAEADSGATYYVMATAPPGEWSRHWPLMQVIYRSVEFNE